MVNYISQADFPIMSCICINRPVFNIVGGLLLISYTANHSPPNRVECSLYSAILHSAIEVFLFPHCLHIIHNYLVRSPLDVKPLASLLLPKIFASVVTCLIWVDWCHTAATWSSEHGCYIQLWIIIDNIKRQNWTNTISNYHICASVGLETWTLNRCRILKI